MRLDEFNFNKDVRARPNYHGLEVATSEAAIKIRDYIHKNCSEFLNQSSEYLYRGINNNPNEVFVGRSQERFTVSGPTNNHSTAWQKTCDLLLHTAGFDALRGNSIFCNGDHSTAHAWGDLHIIIPFNGYKFTYSKKQSGIPASQYNYPKSPILHQLYRAFDEKDNETYISLMKDQQKEINRLATAFVSENAFSNHNIEEAINSTHDIWFTGRYVAIWTDALKYFKGDAAI